MSGSLTIIGPMQLPAGVAAILGRDVAVVREALIHRIESMDKVYHLIDDGEVREWLGGVLPDTSVLIEDLAIFYESSGPNINDIHLEVAEWVMQSPRLGLNTAAVFNGRPDLCVPPAAALSALALANSIPVTILPLVFTGP